MHRGDCHSIFGKKNGSSTHHPPYSSDLNPPDYWRKMELKGHNFSTIETIQESVTQMFKNIPEAYLSQAIEKLGHHARSCIEFNGELVTI